MIRISKGRIDEEAELVVGSLCTRQQKRNGPRTLSSGAGTVRLKNETPARNHGDDEMQFKWDKSRVYFKPSGPICCRMRSYKMS